MNKFNKARAQSQWHDYQIDINQQNLSKEIIERSLKQFWKEIVLLLAENQYLLIQFKIIDVLGNYKSISYVQLVNKNDLSSLISIFLEYWDLKSENYHLIQVSCINFTYRILPLNSEVTESKIVEHKSIKSNKKSNFKLGGFNLPLTMDLYEWGHSHFYRDYSKAIIYKKGSTSEYHVTIFENYFLVEVRVNNKTIFRFKDTMRDKDDLSSFKREMNNQEYIFESGELKLKKIQRKTKFISPIKPSINLSAKILTLDLETRTIDGIMSPYCVCLSDGIELKSFYLSDYRNTTEMLESCIISLMKRKYNGYRIFLHNFSNFDGIFLLKILVNLSADNKPLEPVLRDNQIIEFKFKFANYCIWFRDSYLLLPCSLSELAKLFNVELKGIFPILFVNQESVSLDYVGQIPEFKYFKDITHNQYLEYCKSFNGQKWNLREETIKYCNQDVKTLHQVISKFSDFIFNEVRLDILNYPTLSALALGIYRCKFLGEHQIPIITGQMYHDIKKSYTGGSVDVYKPYGENIYHYDVNSLYPYAMKSYPMPVGLPKFFEGDITKFEDKPYGIFEAEVIAPKDLKIPFLQTRLKSSTGTKTITPLGTWKSSYLSEEVYKAIEIGYKFNILRGYTFDKNYIFTDYVDYFYKMKENSGKGTAQYKIAKLLLNSLYGRFGMNPENEKHVIINTSESFKYYDKFTVTNVLNLDNGKELISYLDSNSNNDDNISTMNISIPIAAAVTAFSRIYMYPFKTLKNTSIFYTDTDSIDIDTELDPEFVGTEIGKWKLEHISEKAVFLGPKLYMCKTSNGYITKIKGLKFSTCKGNCKLITFDAFSKLLMKDKKLDLQQDKWYKNISQGNITIKNENYNLGLTSGKRKQIFDKNNVFTDTKPLTLNNGNLLNE